MKLDEEILRKLGEEGSHFAELADKTGASQGSVAKACYRLAWQGRVSLRRCGRSMIVTPKVRE